MDARIEAAGVARGGIGLPVHGNTAAIAVEGGRVQADAGEAVVDVRGIRIEGHRQRAAGRTDAEIGARDAAVRIHSEHEWCAAGAIGDVDAAIEVDLTSGTGDTRTQGDVGAIVQGAIDVRILYVIAQHYIPERPRGGPIDHIDVGSP